MSFTKTISTVAALASIFGAATAGWKLAESNSKQPPSVLDQRIEQLEKQLEVATQGEQQPAPTTLSEPPRTLPEPSRMPQQVTPAPQVLPPPQTPPPAPPAPPTNELP